MSNLYLFGEIGPASAKEVISQLKRNDCVLINSKGGDVASALSLCDAIQSNQANTIATGIVLSAASLVFQSGKKRSMTGSCLMGFHYPCSATAQPESTQQVRKMLMELVEKRTGLSSDSIVQLFTRESLIGVDEALILKLADEVI